MIYRACTTSVKADIPTSGKLIDNKHREEHRKTHYGRGERRYHNKRRGNKHTSTIAKRDMVTEGCRKSSRRGIHNNKNMQGQQRDDRAGRGYRARST